MGKVSFNVVNCDRPFIMLHLIRGGAEENPGGRRNGNKSESRTKICLTKESPQVCDKIVENETKKQN